MLKILLDAVSVSDRIGRRLLNKSLMLTIGLIRHQLHPFHKSRISRDLHRSNGV